MGICDELKKMDSDINYTGYIIFIKNNTNKISKLLPRLKIRHYKNLNAVFLIGYIYQNIKNDNFSAFEYYEFAASQGNIRAMEGISVMSIDSAKTYDEFKKYFNMLKYCSKKGLLIASIIVGDIYSSDIHIDKDEKKALKYYRKVDKNMKHLEICNIYTIKLYLFAEDETVRDEKRGLVMINVSISKKLISDRNAGEILGQYYLNKNKEEAIKWIKLGITNNSDLCSNMMVKLFS